MLFSCRKTPIGIATINIKNNERIFNNKVAGNLSTIFEITGLSSIKEFPKLKKYKSFNPFYILNMNRFI